MSVYFKLLSFYGPDARSQRGDNVRFQPHGDIFALRYDAPPKIPLSPRHFYPGVSNQCDVSKLREAIPSDTVPVSIGLT